MASQNPRREGDNRPIARDSTYAEAEGVALLPHCQKGIGNRHEKDEPHQDFIGNGHKGTGPPTPSSVANFKPTQKKVFFLRAADLKTHRLFGEPALVVENPLLKLFCGPELIALI